MTQWQWAMMLVALLVVFLLFGKGLISSLVLNQGMVTLNDCLSAQYSSSSSTWSLLDALGKSPVRCARSQEALQWAAQTRSSACSARRNLGLAYLLEGDTIPAIAEFQMAQRDCTDDLLVALYLGFAHWHLNQADDAIRIWQSLPNARENFLQDGYGYRRAGNLRLAAESFSTSGRIDPEFALAHYWEAVALIEMGRPEEAIPALQKAVAADPGYADAFWLLGRQAEMLELSDTARSAYQQLIDLPFDESFKKALAAGRLKYLAQDWSGALADFKKAQMVSVPEHERILAFQYAAETYNRMQNLEAAEEEWKKVIQMNPSGAFHAYVMLGDIKSRQGQWPSALEYYEQARALRPSNSIPLVRAATGWLGLGQGDRAEQEAVAAIALEPNAVSHYLLLAQALEQQNKLCEARKVYLNLLSIDSSNEQAQWKLDELPACQD